MRNISLFSLLIGLAAACSSEPESSRPPGGGTGGSGTSTGGRSPAPTGGANATGGLAGASGGSASISGGSGGKAVSGASGGAAPTGGASASGGKASIQGGAPGGGASGSGGANGGSVSPGGSSGAGTASGGASGSSAGGSGGGGANNGGGGSDPENPKASAGCGKTGRPNGGVVTASSHIYSFPQDYDGATPMPLILALHAAGNDLNQLRNITKSSALEQNFVMAFPQSGGNDWQLNRDSGVVDTRLQDLFANHCIDENRVFATGHSSGAQMIVQLLCRGDRRFRAVAPVAASASCSMWEPLAALNIHGSNDRERANIGDADGRKDLAPYITSNGCSMTTVPYPEVAGCNSGGTQVMPGCVEYQGCSAPLVWCNHNDPQYSNTNHGWPCFANQAINDFFLTFR